MPRSTKKTIRSQILRDFLEIEEKAFHQRIRFYESHEREIVGLRQKEIFLLKEGYADALFQVGAYKKHLSMVDELIEECMNHNIRFFKGEDIFQGLLFRKAASLFQIRKTREAIHILRELIRINPAYRDPARFLARCYRRQRPNWLGWLRAASVVLFILTAVVIALEMLMVNPLFPEMTSDVQMVRNSTFFLGVIALVGGEVWHRLECRSKADQFVRYARRRKNWDK
jgi:tetratricopeptide (TPR) repeat protein